MKVGIPELHGSLDFEPTQTDEKTKDNAGLVLLTAGVVSCLDHIAGDDAAVWVREGALLNLTRNNLLNLIFQFESNFGNLLRRLGGLSLVGGIRRENCQEVSDVTQFLWIMTYGGDALLEGDGALWCGRS